MATTSANCAALPADADADLFSMVYTQLRQLAHRMIRGRNGWRAFTTTALVHELYLDLHGRESVPVGDRARFFAYAAQAMRHILIDEARARLAEKRGAGHEHVAADGLQLEVESEALGVLALDQALSRLVDVNACMAKVVELRFFGGLSVAEAAAVLGIDERSVVRHWQSARLLLQRDLSDQ